MIRILYFILFLFSLSSSFAQPYFDILNVHGQWSNPINNSPQDRTNIKTEQYSTELSIPIKIKKDILAGSVSYSEFSILSVFFSSMRMRSALFSLAYVKQWKNDKIKTSFVFIGRSNDEPSKAVKHDNLQGGIALLHTIKKHDNLKYKLGVYYNSEFFGPFILPLAGIDWKVNERLNIFGVLPGSMNLEYRILKNIHAGFAFRSITNSYRRVNNTFLRINDNHLKAVMDFTLAKKHVITLEAGHSILRKYKPGIRLSGETKYTELEVNNGYLLKIGYAFRIRLDEKK